MWLVARGSWLVLASVVSNSHLAAKTLPDNKQVSCENIIVHETRLSTNDYETPTASFINNVLINRLNSQNKYVPSGENLRGFFVFGGVRS